MPALLNRQFHIAFFDHIVFAYMDGKLSGQREWEKLFEVREDGMFYMGDYVQAEGGGLKEMLLQIMVFIQNQLL